MEMQYQILRRPEVAKSFGASRSSTFEWQNRGLLTRPIQLSIRMVGWPASEIAAIIEARVAGKSETEIKLLVERLHAARAAQ